MLGRPESTEPLLSLSLDHQRLAVVSSDRGELFRMSVRVPDRVHPHVAVPVLVDEPAELLAGDDRFGCAGILDERILGGEVVLDSWAVKRCIDQPADLARRVRAPVVTWVVGSLERRRCRGCAPRRTVACALVRHRQPVAPFVLGDSRAVGLAVSANSDHATRMPRSGCQVRPRKLSRMAITTDPLSQAAERELHKFEIWVSDERGNDAEAYLEAYDHADALRRFREIYDLADVDWSEPEFVYPGDDEPYLTSPGLRMQSLGHKFGDITFDHIVFVCREDAP